MGRFFCAVSLGAPAMQQLGSPRNLFCAAAIKAGFQIDGTAVQRRRHGQHLKGGPRLVAVGKHPVSPLFQPGIHQGLVIGLFPGKIVFRINRILLIRFFQFFQTAVGIGICNFTARVLCLLLPEN